MGLSDAELESIQVRLDAATAKWPPSAAALHELIELAREDLPALLTEVRALRQSVAEETIAGG
jgi:hypothetical protein